MIGAFLAPLGTTMTVCSFTPSRIGNHHLPLDVVVGRGLRLELRRDVGRERRGLGLEGGRERKKNRRRRRAAANRGSQHDEYTPCLTRCFTIRGSRRLAPKIRRSSARGARAIMSHSRHHGHSDRNGSTPAVTHCRRRRAMVVEQEQRMAQARRDGTSCSNGSTGQTVAIRGPANCRSVSRDTVHRGRHTPWVCGDKRSVRC